MIIGSSATFHATDTAGKKPKRWPSAKFSEPLYPKLKSAEGNRNEIFEAELHYNRGFKEHHVGGILKFNQDSKVFTVGTGEDLKKGIARRHLGLAGRVSYNWNYRYFADFNFGYNGLNMLMRESVFLMCGMFSSLLLHFR